MMLMKLARRSALLTLASEVPEDPDSRVVTEEAEIQIVKAILKKSTRKWEFVWRGVNELIKKLGDALAVRRC